jgi:branched-chain amino acid transport system ATP-binding protein
MTERAATPPLLEVDAVTAGYGRADVLHEVSLVVGDGEIVTLIGANGAGKTTTLMTVSGVLRPRRGRVRFGGRDLTGMPTHEIVRAGLVHVPEGRKIFSRLTVLENLEMGAFTRGDAGAIATDLERVFTMFPILGERRRQPGGTLSGGEQQMLAIGRAMMARPKLLLLDEPSLGLAPLVVKRVFEVIAALHAQGVSILLVEQNARMALGLAHRGHVLETGRVTASDRAATLLADPRIRAAYLGG